MPKYGQNSRVGDSVLHKLIASVPGFVLSQVHVSRVKKGGILDVERKFKKIVGSARSENLARSSAIPNCVIVADS